MAKNKLEKPKKLTQVNGKPEFKDGKLVKPQTVPYKKDGKVKNVDIKKVEKEMDKAKFARDNVQERDKFIKRVKKDCAFITIKNVKTSKPDELEPVILFRAKKICQLAFSKVAYFSQYRFEQSGRSIFKPTNQDELDQAFDWLTGRIQQIEDSLNNKEQKKSVTKKPKKAKTTKTPEELVSDIKNRVASMSAKSNGIKFPKTVVGNEDWFKELVESEHYKIDTDNRIIMVA